MNRGMGGGKSSDPTAISGGMSNAPIPPGGKGNSSAGGGGGAYLGGGVAGPYGWASPIPSNTPSTNSNTGSRPTSGRQVDADRLFLFLIVDYLKRRGMATSVAQILAEARIDPMSSDTAETVQLMETLNQMHGRNPQPASVQTEVGFLRDWWGAFWQMYQARLNSSVRRATSSMTSNTSASPMEGAPQAAQVMSRRALIAAAMQSVGLAGRDPQTLTLEEQRIVTLAIQQIQAQHLHRMQVPPVAMKSPVMGSTPSQPVTAPGTPNKKRKASVVAPGIPATSMSSDSGSTPTTLTPQQMLQMKAAQLQQQQQMMLLMGGGATATSSGYYPTPVGINSRVIMPNPVGASRMNTATKTCSSTVAGSRLARNVESKQEALKTFLTSPTPPNGQPELDESALLSFFGSPQDWFSMDPTATGGNAVDRTGMTVDEYGNIIATAPGDKSPNLPLDALALQSLPSSGSSSSSPFLSESVQSPRPEMAISDPTDLLLVTESSESPPTTVKATESGFTLRGIASLGQHTLGSKAASCSFSSDGSLLASGGHDKRILIFNVLSKQLVGVLEGHHSQQVTQVRFAPSGNRLLLASASFDKTICLWDLGPLSVTGDDGVIMAVESMIIPEAPQMLLKDVHEEPIWSIDFVPTSNNGLSHLMSIDAAGKLVIWDLNLGTAIHTTYARHSADRAITIRHVKARTAKIGEPAMLAIADGSNVEFFDCDQNQFVASVAPPEAAKSKTVIAISWGDSSCPDTLATATTDNIAIWDVSLLLRGQGPAILLATHPVPADKVTCCTLLTEKTTGKRLAIFGGYQSIYLWEYEAGGIPSPEHRLRVIKFSAHEGLVVALPVSRSTFMLVPPLIGSASHDGWIKLWDIERLPEGPSVTM